MSSRQPFPWERTGPTLEVETPEHTTVELPLANFGTRLAAVLLDYVIVYGTGLLLILLGVLFLGASGLSGLDERSGILLVLGIFLLLDLGYFTWSELRGGGQTIGKRQLRIRTVGAYGQGLTFGTALLRNLARVVDMLPVSWLLPAFSAGNRRIGDYLAGTYVVEAPKEVGVDAIRGSWLQSLAPTYRELPEKRFPLTRTARDRLKQADLDLLEYLEEQLEGTERRDRKKVLGMTAERYVARLDLEEQRQDVEADPERFLLELGLILRERFEASVY